MFTHTTIREKREKALALAPAPAYLQGARGEITARSRAHLPSFKTNTGRPMNEGVEYGEGSLRVPRFQYIYVYIYNEN